MKKIRGNVTAELQVKTTTKNAIGESIEDWATSYTLRGFLDLSSGDSKRMNYNTKLQESSHIFLCNYQPLEGVSPENSRIIINSIRYDVLLIDNVMELNEHYEISLKRIG